MTQIYVEMLTRECELERQLVELQLEVAALQVRVAELEGKERELTPGDVVRIVGKGAYQGRKAVVLRRHEKSRYYWDLEVKKCKCDKVAPRIYRGRTSLELVE